MEIRTLHLKGRTFRFRAPTRREMVTLETLAGPNQYEFQERLIISCTIEPVISFNDEESDPQKVCMARLPYLLGDVKRLTTAILDASGFYSNRAAGELADRASEYVQSQAGRLDQLACMTIPGLSPEKLWDMDPADVFKIWAMARNMAPVIGFDDRMLLEPEVWAAEQTKLIAERKRQEMQARAEAKASNGQGRRGRNPKAEQEVESSKSFSLG